MNNDADKYDDHDDPVEHWPANGGENEKPSTPPVQIPADLLSADALEALIEAFILREGTDYGANEVMHETKQRQVRQQLERDHVKIIFDPDSESVTLMRAEEWSKLNARE